MTGNGLTCNETILQKNLRETSMLNFLVLSCYIILYKGADSQNYIWLSLLSTFDIYAAESF